MPGACGFCGSVARCRCSPHKDWENHQAQCAQSRKHIIFPSKADDNDASSCHEISRSELTRTIRTINELHALVDHRKSYNDIDVEIELTNELLQAFIDILLRANIYWKLQRLHIEFITDDEDQDPLQHLDPALISDLFIVISRLPKLASFSYENMCNDPEQRPVRTCYEQVDFEVHTRYFNAFKRFQSNQMNNCFQSLTGLRLSVSEVFHRYRQFNVRDFLRFIKTSGKLESVDVSMKYWTHREASDVSAYMDAVDDIFKSLSSRAKYGRSLHEFSFEIWDLRGEYIDDIDEAVGNNLLRALRAVVASHPDLRIFRVNQRPFSERLMNQLFQFIAHNCPHLTEITIGDFEMWPNEKSELNPAVMLSMIAKLRSLESLQLDGYILWTPATLNRLADVINEHCKQMKSIRAGWITIESKSDWQTLMSIFEHNPNMRAIFFYAHGITSDVFNDDAKNIICQAVLQNIRSFNDHMVRIKKILDFHFEEIPCLTQQVFEYLKDDELGEDVTIAISQAQDVISTATSAIEKYVNQQIHSIKHELSFYNNNLPSFEFRVDDV